MKWNELFNAEQMPSGQDIRDFMGESAPLWDDLLAYVEKTYVVKPQSAYSKCSAQPGWNIKYKKSSKSLCTLYPMPVISSHWW